MNRTPFQLLAVGVVSAVLAAAGAYWWVQRGMRDAPATTERKVLYWYDPMVPNQHFDQPGKSPYMDMQLVPRYADEAAETTTVRIDPAVTQNLGVRLTSVQRSVLAQPLDVVGAVTFDQRQVAVMQTRTSGYVTRVYARAPGEVVTRDAPLVDVLAPEWAGAQTEYLALRSHDEAALRDAARQRLVLLGMPEELIQRLESTQQVSNTFTLRAPIAGVIESLEVRQGMTLSAGATLATLNGLDPVWVEAAVPESQALQAAGRTVEVRLTAEASKVRQGRVIATLPQLNADTRTLRVRIELPNADGALRPGMFAQVRLQDDRAEPVLHVASEAIIRSGTRNLVLRAGGEGRFTPTVVQLGSEVGDQTIILDGVSEGQQVVASGQFLIDSEASLRGVLARLQGASASSASSSGSAAALHEAVGKVESIHDGEIMLSHGPVASLDWPAMTMGFVLQRPELAQGIEPGDTVTVEFRQGAAGYVIEQLRRENTP